ncbi:MAG: TRAP transporter substrate-binding protein DctP [Spirochaetota bacterium]
MMKRTVSLATLIFLLFVTVTVGAPAITIKVASAAPEGSPWGEALNRIAADWEEASGGEVTMQIFHNSIAGEEDDVVRKMRVGQIDAGIFTTVGLAEIAGEIKTISTPFLIRTDEEFEYVFDQVRDDFADLLEQRRFNVLGWSKGGWIRFFADEPIRVPADLKDITLAAGGNDTELLRAFRVMGFQITPVGLTEVLTALNSGMISAFYASPISAAGFQWFSQAPNMLDVKVAPFIGGFVTTDRAWGRIPEDLKPRLLDAVESTVERLDQEVISLEQEAVDTMQSYGLNVIEPTDRELRLWFDILDDNEDALVGDVFPRQEYEMILGHLRDFRR